MILKLANHKQHGATLIIILILLLILTIMAIGEVQFNSNQTKIATNSADSEIAFHTAEGALNQGINLLLAGSYTPSSFMANSGGLYLFSANNPPIWSNLNWSSGNAIISYKGKSNASAAYIIEQLPSVTLSGQSMKKSALVFRITARAVGASGNSPVILQATLQIPQ